MTWKNTFTTLIVALSTLILIQIGIIVQYGFGTILNPFGLIGFAGLIIFFIYIYFLNKAFEQNNQNNNLKNLEYVSYVFIALNIIPIDRSLFFITLSYQTFKVTIWLIPMLINIITIGLLIYSFILRKKTFGRFLKVKNDELVYDLESLKHKSFETDKQRLEVCKLCTNRTFDKNVGMVCSLTLAKPTFKSMCTDFNLDTKEYQKRVNEVIENGKNSKKKSVWAYIVTAIIVIRIIIKIIQSS